MSRFISLTEDNRPPINPHAQFMPYPATNLTSYRTYIQKALKPFNKVSSKPTKDPKDYSKSNLCAIGRQQLKYIEGLTAQARKGMFGGTKSERQSVAGKLSRAWRVLANIEKINYVGQQMQRRRYGMVSRLATLFGVSRQTIYDWVDIYSTLQNAILAGRNMLKASETLTELERRRIRTSGVKVGEAIIEPRPRRRFNIVEVKHTE